MIIGKTIKTEDFRFYPQNLHLYLHKLQLSLCKASCLLFTFPFSSYNACMCRTFPKVFLVFLFINVFSFVFSEKGPGFSESDEKDEFNEEISDSPHAESASEKSKFNLPANAIIFFRDLLNDKYPLRIDFGAEPHRHGSMVFASVDYDWSDTFSQRFRFEYDHYMTSEKSSASLANQEVRSINIMPFPVVFFFWRQRHQGSGTVYSVQSGLVS